MGENHRFGWCYRVDGMEKHIQASQRFLLSIRTLASVGRCAMQAVHTPAWCDRSSSEPIDCILGRSDLKLGSASFGQRSSWKAWKQGLRRNLLIARRGGRCRTMSVFLFTWISSGGTCYRPRHLKLSALSVCADMFCRWACVAHLNPRWLPLYGWHAALSVRRIWRMRRSAAFWKSTSRSWRNGSRKLSSHQSTWQCYLRW